MEDNELFTGCKYILGSHTEAIKYVEVFLRTSVIGMELVKDIYQKKRSDRHCLTGLVLFPNEIIKKQFWCVARGTGTRAAG